MSAATMMIHRCAIERNTPTNEHGVITPDWNEIASGVRCLLQEKNGRLPAGPAGQVLEYDAILFVPPSQDLRPRGSADRCDRIVMERPERVAGTIFLVRFVADRSGMGNHQTAYLTRVAAGET